MKAIREMFSDESGTISSTRIMGFIAMLSGLYLNAIGKLPAASQALTIACTLLGIGQVKSAVVKSIKKTEVKPLVADLPEKGKTYEKRTDTKKDT